MPIKEVSYKSALTSEVSSFIEQKRLAKSGGEDGNVDFLSVIDFIEKFKLLPYGLYPVQKFIVKLYYNIPLDNSTRNIKITDRFNSRVLYELSEVEYLKYLYDQGRCNIKEQDGKPRYELILCIGRRSGKCSDINTQLYTADGILSLGELLSKYNPNKEIGWKDTAITVPQEYGRRVVANSLYYGGVQSTLRVKTYCGFSLNSTPEHRVKVMGEGGLIEWKYFKDLKVGDYVAINRSCDLWTDKYLDTSEHYKSAYYNHSYHDILRFSIDRGPKISRSDILARFPASTLKIKTLLLKGLLSKVRPGVYEVPCNSIKYSRLDEDLGLLLGILVGDGTWNVRNRVEVTGGCEEFLSFLAPFIDKFVGSHVTKRRPHMNNTCEVAAWQIRGYSTDFRKFLGSLGYSDNTTTSSKRVPWSIFKSPKSVVASFLRGLFETDGGMEKGNTISLSSHSELLVDDVQKLLLNFGIISRVSKKLNKKFKSKNYILNVLGGNSRKIFAEHIGFITNRKNNILKNSLHTVTHGCSDTESIPNLKHLLRSIRESMPKGYGTGSYLRSEFKEACGGVLKPNIKEDISYDRLRRVRNIFGEFIGESYLSSIDNILSSNYFWDPIVRIEASQAEVADLNVPEGHEYVANGIENHNSSLSAIFAAYEMYKLLRRGNPQAFYGMPGGSEIRVLCVANDKEQASIVYGDMQSHVESVDYFKNSIANTTQTFMKFRTENDRARFGDCISADSYIYTDSGMIKISELPHSADALAWAGLNAVVALEGCRKGEAVAIYNGGQRSTLHVTTKSGYSINGTEDHKVKVLSKDGDIVWRRLADIQLGDRIGIHRTCGLWPNNYLDTSELVAASRNALPGHFLGALEKFSNWISGLEHPVTLSKRSVSEETGINIHSLRQVIAFLERSGNTIKKTTRNPKFGDGSSCTWIPCIPKYDITDQRFVRGPIKWPDILDESWGELLGILVGDGTWGAVSGISVTGGCSEFLGYLESKFKLLFGYYDLRYRRTEKTKGETPWNIRVHSKPLRRFLDKLGYKPAKPAEKSVPFSIRNSPKPVVAAFLRGLFETDGTVGSRGKGISFTTASRTLAKEVQLLLLNFGIISSLHSKPNKVYDRECYTVSIIGAESWSIFKAEIGFISKRKYSRLEAVLAYANREVIPHLSSTLRDLIDFAGSHGISRTALVKIAGGAVDPNRLSGISYHNLRRFVDVCRPILHIDPPRFEKVLSVLNAAYYWDEASSIRPESSHVFDLHVPVEHAYVAQGFMSHNSGKATITATFKSSIAKGLRGRGVICAILDEIAFFVDDGRCISLDSLVLTDSGLKTMEAILSDAGVDKTSPGWAPISFGIKKENGCDGAASAVYYGGKKHVKSITTKSGYHLTGTPEHRVKVMDLSGNILWKYIGDLQVGNYVGINRKTDLWAKEYHDVSSIVESIRANHSYYEYDLAARRFASWISSLKSSEKMTRVALANSLSIPIKILNKLLLRASKLGYKTWDKILDPSTHKLSVLWNPVVLPETFYYINELNAVNLPNKINESYGELLGILVGDGTWDKRGAIQVTGGCEQFRKYLQSKLISMFGKQTLRRRWSPNSTCEVSPYDVTVYSTALRQFLFECGYDNSEPRDKHTPWVIFKSPKSVVARYLSGLFETDGGLEQGGSTISFCSVSKRLVSETQTLLLNFGITSSIYSKNKGTIKEKHILRVIGACSREIFAREIGFITERKNSSLIRGLRKKRDASNIIPHQADRLRRILSTIPSNPGKKSNGDLRTQYTRLTASQLSREHNSDLSYSNAVKIVDLLGDSFSSDTSDLAYICEANYFWDPITTIDHMETEVADLRVPEGEQYVAQGMTNHNSSAERIYTAITPSLAQFSPRDPNDKLRPIGPSEGRMILISSPDAKEGFFYRAFQLAMAGDKGSADMLVVQAPTWEVNPTLDRSYYEKEYHKNPVAFTTEHGAEFSDRVRGWIEDSRDLLECVDPNLKPAIQGRPREIHFAGIDVGLVNDGTVITLSKIHNGKIELVYHEAWYAKKRWKEVNPHLTSPLVPYAHTLQDQIRIDMAEIANWFKALSTKFYIHKAIFDQWSGIVFEQELHKQGLKQFEIRNFFTSESSQMYQTFKMFMYNRQLKLYDYPLPSVEEGMTAGRHSPLITELLELQAVSGGKNIITVEAPKAPGKHDDMADSLARSILLASEYISENPGILDPKIYAGNSAPLPVRLPTYHQFHRMRKQLHGGNGSRNTSRTRPR